MRPSAASARSVTPTPEMPMQVQSPEEFPHAFAKAWMTRDGHAIAALFAEDADFVNVVGIWWEDRAAVAKAHDYALKSFFAQSRLTVGRIKVRYLGADHALVHARVRLSGQIGAEGAVAGDRSTILSFVLVRRSDDDWRALSAQNTDIIPGAETFRASSEGLKPTDYRD